MIKIISNGSKFYGQEPDTIEILLDVLKKETLDPYWEKLGNFVDRNPNWLKKEAKEKYKDCTVIFGNFSSVSHVFNIITDEEELIQKLEQAINNNKQTVEYQELRKTIV